MELVYWVLINIIYLVTGLVFFIIRYETKKFTIDVTKKSEEQHEASLFIFLYVLLAPTLAHGLVVGLRLADQGRAAMDKVFIGMGVGFVLGLVGMIVCCFLFV
jgi:succinate dehydrogenase hydrophobic anchor subunit